MSTHRSLFEDEPLGSAAEWASALVRDSVPAGHFDELHGAPAGVTQDPSLATHWQRFFEPLGLEGVVDLTRRQAELARRVVDNGVSFNAYDQTGQSSRPWSLDLLPFIVPSEDWQSIERGVIQRAKLLCQMMHDAYGAQRLLHEGLVPSALVLGSPGYLRGMHGARPCGGMYLHIAAFDLARQPDGHWAVVSQRCQSPSGLGYLLENRMLCSGLFSDAFVDLRVQRLAGTYRALVDNLKRLSGAGSAAHIVLLTPGRYSETYFEHVFLARYLGLALVEGTDLMVRDQRLFLKTLQGLEPVHGVLRRVDDPYLDPLEMRSDSMLGVPGLMQAVRAGNVLVANAPGAAWLESPALLGFLPGVCKALLDEALLLPSLPTWWCGEEAARDEAYACLSEGVIKATGSVAGSAAARLVPHGEPLIGSRLNEAARNRVWHQVMSAPEEFTVQAYNPQTHTPVWTGGSLCSRQAMLRVYAIADGLRSWRVLPGGLARIAGPTQANVSMQRGGSSVDVWVMTRGTVDRTTLVPPPLTPQDLRNRHRPVSSRAGENLFWLGRYTERAENTSRLARLSLELLNGAERPSAAMLRAMHALCVENGVIAKEVPLPESAAAKRIFERSLIDGLGSASAASSVAFCLANLRNAAHSVRERLSREHWELMVNAADEFAEKLQGVAVQDDAVVQAMRALNELGILIAAITGSQIDRMTRDAGWRLLSIGRQIERLGMLSNALGQSLDSGMLAEDAGFNFMLGVFDSTITYNAQFQRRRELAALLDLLVLDPDNPRALAWIAKTLTQALAKLPGEQADQLAARVPPIASWSLDALVTPQGEAATDLGARMGLCQDQAYMLSEALSQALFSHVREASHSVGI